MTAWILFCPPVLKGQGQSPLCPSRSSLQRREEMPSCERVLGCPLAARRNAGLRVGGGRGKCPFHYLLKRFTFASSSQLTYALYSFFHLDSSFIPAHLYEIKRPLIIIIFLLPCRKLNAVPCLWFRTGHQTTATPTKPSPEKQKGSVLCGEGGKGLPRPVGVHAERSRRVYLPGGGQAASALLSSARCLAGTSLFQAGGRLCSAGL